MTLTSRASVCPPWTRLPSLRISPLPFRASSPPRLTAPVAEQEMDALMGLLDADGLGAVEYEQLSHVGEITAGLQKLEGALAADIAGQAASRRPCSHFPAGRSFSLFFIGSRAACMKRKTTARPAWHQAEELQRHAERTAARLGQVRPPGGTAPPG